MNNIEVETKVLDVPVDHITTQLNTLGAQKVIETRLTVDWYRPIGVEEDEDPWFLRVRSNSQGKHELTWKAIENAGAISRSVEEINFFVSDAKTTGDFLTHIGLEHYAHQEKDRISWKYKDWKFDLDIYPNMPAFLEIEGHSTTHIQEALQLLNLTNKPTWTKGERILIQTIYKLDWYNMRF